jgi:large subunit ribosomal protein L25
MMNEFEIAAELRVVQGKGASRRLRGEGKVPAIVYGADQEPISIQLRHYDVVQHTEHEAFYSHVLTLKLDSKEEKVVLKDMQRHPHKAQILHMDFQRIDENEELTMRVPIHFINEDVCVGVKTGGGVISHLLTELEIVCLPRDLPEYIEVDVGGIDLGHSVHLSEISVPDGVKIAALLHGGDGSQPIVSVRVPKIIVEEIAEAAEAEEMAGEEGEEGEEGAEAPQEQAAEPGDKE